MPNENLKDSKYSELIREAIDTRNKNILPVFCLVKDRVGSHINKDTQMVWKFFMAPERDKKIILSPKDANSLIELYEMQPFVTESCGKVYDTPNQDFRMKFHKANVPSGL